MDGRPAVCCTEKSIQGTAECQHHKGNDLYSCSGAGKGDDYVQVSGNAASQPQTRLGMREGQQFYLEDLLIH